MVKPKIFFVDDEVTKTYDYRLALEKYFEVVHISTFQSQEVLVNLIVSEGPSIFVQDLMMPRGEDDRIDINAGIEIAENLKSTLVGLGIPLIFFSNRMLREFEAEVSQLGYPEKLLHVKFKPSSGYADFALFVWQVYNSHNALS